MDSNAMAEGFGDAITSIYWYERSYFRSQIAPGVFPLIEYGDSVGESPVFCLGVSWHNQ
jgi:hypothetical protein